MTCCSKTRLILDMEDRIIAVLVGQPCDPLWKDVAHAATEVMQEAECQGADLDLFTEKSLSHRRGEFLALPAGVSFGGGQTVCATMWPKLFNLLLTDFILQAPGNLVHTAATRKLIKGILQSHSVKRIAGFQSSMLRYVCPELQTL
jgi:hypothetical protein